MNEQESTRRTQPLKQQINQRFELLALRLQVHGPEAATRVAVRQLARTEVALELRNLLRSHGFTPTEIAELMNDVHPPGCPCWDCVIALNKAVRKSRGL